MKRPIKRPIKVCVVKFDYEKRLVSIYKHGTAYSVDWCYKGEVTEPFEIYETEDQAAQEAKLEIEKEILKK